MTLLEALCRPLLPVCLASRKPWRAIALPSIVFRYAAYLTELVMPKQENEEWYSCYSRNICRQQQQHIHHKDNVELLSLHRALTGMQ
jgi:hypothetical protein